MCVVVGVRLCACVCGVSVVVGRVGAESRFYVTHPHQTYLHTNAQHTSTHTWRVASQSPVSVCQSQSVPPPDLLTSQPWDLDCASARACVRVCVCVCVRAHVGGWECVRFVRLIALAGMVVVASMSTWSDEYL